MTSNKFKIYVDIGANHIVIPVLPQEIPVSYSADHKTYNILDIGEIIVPGKRNLMKVSFKSYFPGNENDPLISGKPFKKPSYYIEQFENALNLDARVNLTICRYDTSGKQIYDTNINAVIEDFKAIDKGGEPGDIYYEISFREYRDYSPIPVLLQTQIVGTVAQQMAQRPMGAGKLAVGVKVIANGTYFASSYGDKPTGKASNLNTVVSRIVSSSSRPYPILIGGGRGWVSSDQVQVVP